jgi:hypothetical protein
VRCSIGCGVNERAAKSGIGLARTWPVLSRSFFLSLEARSLEHIAVRWILAAGAEKSILDVNSCGVPGSAAIGLSGHYVTATADPSFATRRERAASSATSLIAPKAEVN